MFGALMDLTGIPLQRFHADVRRGVGLAHLDVLHRSCHRPVMGAQKVPPKPATADFFEGNHHHVCHHHQRAPRASAHHLGPGDKSFWEREGEAIAKINLWISVLRFIVWRLPSGKSGALWP